jgi:4-hydroxy-tetrahydrodipicolinate synthase
MMPILPTAIQESGELDEKSQRRLVQYCLKCGAVAIGHLGGASEFQKVADADRRRSIEIVVDEAAGRVPVFIGATAPATRAAVNYAREAEAAGAKLLMVAPPYVFSANAGEVVEYYKAVSDATSLPIIVQDTPASDALLSVDLVCRMYEEIEHIAYIKAEGKDFVSKTAALRTRLGDRMGVIGGAGGRHMIHLLRTGVTSFMTGTEALDLHAAVVAAYLDGDEARAAELYFERVLPYLMFYSDHNRELLKYMLWRRGVIDCPKVIPPVGSPLMGEANWREFEWILQRVELTSKWPDIPHRFGTRGGR